MNKRISKRVREEAAVLCSVIACTEFDPIHAMCSCAICVRSELHPDDEAWCLALRARDAVPREIYPGTNEDYGLRFAEAEALLRTGWSP